MDQYCERNQCWWIKPLSRPSINQRWFRLLNIWEKGNNWSTEWSGIVKDKDCRDKEGGT